MPPASRITTSGAQVSHSCSPGLRLITRSSSPRASALYFTDAPIGDRAPVEPGRRQAGAEAAGGVEAAHADAHLGDVGDARRAQHGAARLPVAVVDARAAAGARRVEPPRHRLEDRAHHGDAVDRQADVHAELVGARHEVARAVERIDDPDAPLAEALDRRRAAPR